MRQGAPGPVSVGTPTFGRSIPHALGGARITWGEAARETTASSSVKSGSVGIPWRDSSDANLTLEANTHMQAELRKRKSETELAPLYWRRNTLRLLIRSLERYQIGTRHGQRCSRRKQLAAA